VDPAYASRSFLAATAPRVSRTARISSFFMAPNATART
jgi:hypothetical protein